MKLEELFNWASIHIRKHSIANKSILPLNGLTVFIPTYNRHAYLIRQMVYLSHFPMTAIVLDGSEKSLPKKFINLFSKFENIKYYHLKASIPERIRFALNLIHTPYVMCLADDDFYIPSGLLEAINKLKKNEKNIACMGQSIGFDIFGKKGFFFPYGESLKNYSVTKNKAIDRIFDGIKNYRSAAFYALFKKSEFINIWKHIQSSSCPELMEYEHAIMTYLYGRLITSNSVYWVRSFECDPVPSKADGNRSINFAKWYVEDLYRNERKFFLKRVSNILAYKLNITNQLSNFETFKLCNFIYKGSHKGLMNYPSQYKWFFLFKIYLQKYLPSSSVFQILNTKISTYLKTIIQAKVKKSFFKEYIKNPIEDIEYLFVLKIAESFSDVFNNSKIRHL